MRVYVLCVCASGGDVYLWPLCCERVSVFALLYARDMVYRKGNRGVGVQQVFRLRRALYHAASLAPHIQCALQMSPVVAASAMRFSSWVYALACVVAQLRCSSRNRKRIHTTFAFYNGSVGCALLMCILIMRLRNAALHNSIVVLNKLRYSSADDRLLSWSRIWYLNWCNTYVSMWCNYEVSNVKRIVKHLYLNCYWKIIVFYECWLIVWYGNLKCPRPGSDSTTALLCTFWRFTHLFIYYLWYKFSKNGRFIINNSS